MGDAILVLDGGAVDYGFFEPLARQVDRALTLPDAWSRLGQWRRYGALCCEPFLYLHNQKELRELLCAARQYGLPVALFSMQDDVPDLAGLQRGVHYDAFVYKCQEGALERVMKTLGHLCNGFSEN